MSDMRQRWVSFWERYGKHPHLTLPAFDHLQQLYAEPHRKYHTLRHIEYCLDLFEPVRHLAFWESAVWLALWYHDAIYDTRATDNEERSAKLADNDLANFWCHYGLRSTVCDLIMATKNHTRTHCDSQLIVDIDLSILGESDKKFQSYDRAIREEYAWVPEAEYRKGRTEILESFLKRDNIYCLPYFQERYEKKARENLTRAIASLR